MGSVPASYIPAMSFGQQFRISSLDQVLHEETEQSQTQVNRDQTLWCCSPWCCCQFTCTLILWTDIVEESINPAENFSVQLCDINGQVIQGQG
ncbi:unnamed protein product [Calypogeia fissa]